MIRISVFFLLSFCLFAQQNKIVTDQKTGEPMLVGICETSDLRDSAFGKWFNEEYDFYEVNPEDLNGVSDLLDNVEIIIVLGTWCDDSHILVPRVLKVLDVLQFTEDKIKLISVDRSKKGLNDEVDDLVIDLVPTIIFYRNKSEIGRIIESVRESVEVDIAGIVLAENN